jgi:hypothetical protein
MDATRMRFVGPSYELQHRKADVQRVVNLMPVINEVPGGKSVAYLDSVPGLSTFSVPTDQNESYLMLENGNFLLNEDGTLIQLE